MIGRAANIVGYEIRLLGYACLTPRLVWAKLSLLAGLAYLVGPLDLIPARASSFGHLDEAGFVLGGLALARLSAASSLAFTDARPAPVPPLADVLFELLGYRLWWACRAPFAPRCSALTSLVVIGGSPRSGTTLLRTMLGRHHAVATLPETTVFLQRVSSPEDIGRQVGWPAGLIRDWQRQSRSQAEFIERFHNHALARSGKRIWADKTPWNVLRFGFVRRRFPHARVVHIVRDGRDVVCSLRRKPFSKIGAAAPASALAARRCAAQWRKAVRAGLRFRGDPAYFELRYEDLVQAREPTLRALLDFVGLPWDDAILDPGSPACLDPDAVKAAGEVFDSSVGRWRRDLSDEDLAAIRPLTCAALSKLGYEAPPSRTDFKRPSQDAPRSVRGASAGAENQAG